MRPIIVNAGVNEVVVNAYSTLIMAALVCKGAVGGGGGSPKSRSDLNSTVYSQENASCAIY